MRAEVEEMMFGEGMGGWGLFGQMMGSLMSGAGMRRWRRMS